MINHLSKEASPSERLDFILKHIYNHSQGPTSNKLAGKRIDLQICCMHLDPSYFGLEQAEEIAFYLETLVNDGYLSNDGHTSLYRSRITYQDFEFPQNRKITFKGLSRLAELEREGINSNRCFVAMAFDEKMNDRMLAIKGACKERNYEAFIVNEYYSDKTETIDSKIIAAIKSSKFIIADFTGINQGAYLEAGFAMGRDMKVIFLCEEKDFMQNKKHFDVNHYPFVMYRNYEELKEKLIIEIDSYI